MLQHLLVAIMTCFFCSLKFTVNHVNGEFVFNHIYHRFKKHNDPLLYRYQSKSQISAYLLHVKLTTLEYAINAMISCTTAPGRPKQSEKIIETSFNKLINIGFYLTQEL
jgi:hypothetical protein